MERFELSTSSLPRKRSTPELHWRSLSGRRGSNPRPLAWKANALPTELLPQFSFLFGDFCVGLTQKQTSNDFWWEKMDSNHRRYKPADLQSAPFGHSGILPFSRFFFGDFSVEPRIVGRSLPSGNSLPPHSSALNSLKNKLRKIS